MAVRDSVGRQWLQAGIMLAPAKAAPALVTLAITLALTHFGSPAAVGEFGLAMTTVVLVSTLLTTWTEQSAVRFYPIGERDRGTFHASHFHLTGTTALIAFVGGLLATIVTWFLAPATAAPVALGGAVVTTAVIVNGRQAVLLAQQRYAIYSGVETVRAGLSVSIAFVALAQGYGVVSLIGAFLVGNLAGALVAYVIIPPTRSTADFRYFRRAAQYGIPLIGWVLGSQILAVSDRYILLWFGGAEQVGLYHTSYQFLPGLVTLALTPFLLAAHPVILRAASGDRTHFEATLSRWTTAYLLVSLPFLTTVAFLARDIEALVFPAAFAAAWPVASLVILGLLGWNLAMYVQKRHEASALTRRMLGLVMVAAAVDFILTLALVPFMGYIGAALATVISYWLYPILLLLDPAPSARMHLPRRLVAILAGLTVVAGLVALTVSAMLAGESSLVRIVALTTITCAVWTVGLIGTGTVNLANLRAAVSDTSGGGSVIDR